MPHKQVEQLMDHITVLKQEAINALAIEARDIIVDATYGGGGHSRAILEYLGPEGKLLSIDADPTAFVDNPITDSRHAAVVDNFRNLADILMRTNVGPVDGILADLGWRSQQFEAGERGFSFQKDEPLLMTYGDPTTHLFTAYDVVNEWGEENLADVIYGYGGERFSRRIAKAIVEARAIHPIETSLALAEIVAHAIPHVARGHIHPATKTFQAIRIAVNDELGALEQLIQQGFAALAPGGRLVLITFHSLEDRAVKHAFRTLAHSQIATLITKKPIVASPEELAHNPRARSAKLRIIEKTT